SSRPCTASRFSSTIALPRRFTPAAAGAITAEPSATVCALIDPAAAGHVNGVGMRPRNPSISRRMSKMSILPSHVSSHRHCCAGVGVVRARTMSISVRMSKRSNRPSTLQSPRSPPPHRIVVVVVVVVVVLCVVVVVVRGGVVVVVVVQPGMRVCVQPTGTLHASTVQASKSSQNGTRQVASQQAFGTPPVSHVSGNSTIRLPQVGHGIRQLLWTAVVQSGSCVTSLGTRDGVKPVVGSAAPIGSATLLRLVGATPVVLICAPGSTMSARRAVSPFRAWVSPLVSRIAVLRKWMVQPSSEARTAATPDDEPFACTLPPTVRSPGRSGVPATRQTSPPALPAVAAPALASTIEPVESVRLPPASRSSTHTVPPPPPPPVPVAVTGTSTVMGPGAASVMKVRAPPQPPDPPSAATLPPAPAPTATEPAWASSEIVPPNPPASPASVALWPAALMAPLTPVAPLTSPPAHTSMVPPDPASPNPS